MNQVTVDESSPELLRALGDSLRSMMSDRAGPLTSRAVDEGRTASLESIRDALVDLGVFGIGIPESAGGAGGNLEQRAVASRELGRQLSPVSLVAASAAAALLTGVGLAETDAAVRDLADGSPIGLAVVADEDPAPRCESSGGGALRIVGRLVDVMEMDGANRLLVLGTEALLVDVTPQTVAVDSRSEMGVVRDRCRVSLDSATGIRIPVPTSEVRAALSTARLMLAFEMLGAAEAVLDTAVAYAKTREQFGKPIGSHQAVAHRLADQLINMQAAQGAAQCALRLCHTDSFGTAAWIAREVCSQALVTIAEQSMQVLGAVSYTWEHPLHHYLKYGKVCERVLGAPGDATRHIVRVLAAS